jgi:ribosomal protein S2
MSEKTDKKEIAKQYIKASVHYGHSPREWNPKMAPYILYAKYGYHIFDLVKTSKLLRLAGNVLQKKLKKVVNSCLLVQIKYLHQLLLNKQNVVMLFTLIIVG